MTRSRGAAIRASVVLCLLLGAVLLSAQAPTPPARGRTRVLVQLRLPGAYVAEGRMPTASAIVAQRRGDWEIRI